MKSTIQFFEILTLVLFSTHVSAHSLSIYEIDEADAGIENVLFNHMDLADFNGDGVKDRARCFGAENRVRIVNGADNSVIFDWDGPEVNKLADKSTRMITGCQIVEIEKGYPSIVVSMTFNHPIYGARVRANQFVLLNHKGTFKVRFVRISEARNFTAAARSVKCNEYPRRLVKKGYKHGALCFYAAYDAGLGNGLAYRNYGTMTSLLKLETNANGDLIVKDLTASSELPWRGGVNGTPIEDIPLIRMCGGSLKYDGLHMMDSAFVDFDGDGLKDIVTVAQHASIRSHKMVIDRNKSEGIRFVTEKVTQGGCGEMTEFLTVSSFSERETQLKSQCVYITGEFDQNSSSSHAVPDHIRCFENNRWIKVDLPGEKFSSHYVKGRIRTNGDGKIIIKGSKFNQKGEFEGDKFFAIDFTGDIVGRSRVKLLRKFVRIKGWVCQENTNKSFKIIAASGDLAKSNTKIYSMQSTDLEPLQRAYGKCLQPNQVPYRFVIKIPKSELLTPKGKIFVYADHSSLQTPFLLDQHGF